MNRMLFPESENPEDLLIRLRKFICLVLLAPEASAAEILSSLSYFEYSEENRPSIESFFFEMARSDSFVHQLNASALSDFIATYNDTVDGIDHARVLGESVYGEKRMVEMINNLTEELLRPEDPSPDETN